MIFVTVGMHPIGFERLVREMDVIAGKLEEDEVIMQIGRTTCVTRHAKCFDFATEQENRFPSTETERELGVQQGICRQISCRG